jgi:two-component system OmpR family sensor kinase
MEEFWGRVTHEIKTPITGVKAFLQSLKNQSLDPDQLPRFIDMALKQVEKQEQLAENILAGYGICSRKDEYEPDIKDLDLNKCIREYFEHHALHLTDASVSLHRETGKDLMVRADCHILRVILDNIVDNALRYCSPGLVLEVGVSLWDNRAVLIIRDNGPGFPPGLSEKIFNAYKYLGEELPGKTHGSGMGLYISRHLAEKMGGWLEAHSRGEGQGAEFRLFLNPAKT